MTSAGVLDRAASRVESWLLLVLVWLVPALANGDESGRKYAFTAPPLEIYRRLTDAKLGEIPALADGEQALLSQAWDLRAKHEGTDAPPIDDAVLLDAFLLASGIEQASQRQKYRERFDALLVKAREDVKETKDARQRGERLMKFLHGEVMKEGYVEEQTSFAGVFDTGKYNCVSAAAIYYAVGSRLGLALAPFSIPGSEHVAGHASLDLIDGNDRLQVEPTNPDGFDWQRKIKQPGVRVYGFVPDREKGYPTDALGLAASIYSNRGVALVKDEKNSRPWQAARCFLGALALDPADEAACNNLTSIFVNAGPKLAEERKFEDGLRALAFGISFAPHEKKLRGNDVHVWALYIEHTLAAGKDKEAVGLVRRAAAAEPDEDDFKSASFWFRQHGQTVAKEQGWEAGLAVADRGLAVVDDNEQQALRDFKSSLFRQWSEALLEKQDAQGSLDVLKRAYALNKQDRQIHDGIGYHTLEALGFLRRKGLPAAIEHARILRKEFPDVEDVGENCWALALGAVNDRVKQQKFTEAVTAAKDLQSLLLTKESQAELGAAAYDGWARHLAKKNDLQAAVDKYAEGLEAYPNEKLLVQNTAATVVDWAKPAIKEKKWDQAIDIYDAGLKVLPDHQTLLQNKKYCEQMKAQGK